MNTKSFILISLLFASIAYSSACSKMDERNLNVPAPETPPGPAEAPYTGVLDSSGQPLAKSGREVDDGQVFTFANGKSFILSSRGTSNTVFSTRIPMQENGQTIGASCLFESADCSGDCQVDGNYGRPDLNALLIANNWGETQGPAARVYTYDGSALSDQVIEVHSRLDLYGYGPYCGSISAISDHHYTLKDVTSDYPGLDNTGWTLQVK